MLVAPLMAPASVMPPPLLSMLPVKEEGPVVAVMDEAESAPLAETVVAPAMAPASVMPPPLLLMPRPSRSSRQQ